MHEYHFWVYIVGSNSGTLYVGMTNDITLRVKQHKEGLIEGFTKKYGCDRLLYYEHHQYVRNAIRREKELKGWRRSRKIALIESQNPRWADQAENWGSELVLPNQSLWSAK